MVKYTRSNKRRLRKFRKTARRRMRGGNILPEDIMYKDREVCILKPEVKKGVLVFTDYTQPKNSTPLCEAGLKTGYQLHREGINFGRSIHHPYIFFKAPFYANPIDYSSLDSEIESSYGPGMADIKSRVWIRVDPDKTFVYSSQLRTLGARNINGSRKTMTEYLRIIDENKALQPGPDQEAKYHLISSEKHLVRKSKFQFNNNNNNMVWSDDLNFLNYNPIETNSEVLVPINHLTPNYFVKCS
jgi:hypothetical protein